MNGQLHAPPGDHSHSGYWLPLTTLDGTEVLRKVNADTAAGDPSDSFEWVDAVEDSSVAGAGASSYALTASPYALTASPYALTASPCALTVGAYADTATDPPPYREAPEYAQAVAGEWVEANAPDGRRYWYRSGTNETTWQDPHGGTAPVFEVPQPTPPPPPLPPPAAQIWDQLKAEPHGQVYFHSPNTNETAWQPRPGAILRATPAHQPARPHTAQLPARQTETSWPTSAGRVVRDTETFDEIASFFRSKPPAGHTQSSAEPPSRELRESRLAEARNRGAGASPIGMPPGMTGMPGFRGAGG